MKPGPSHPANKPKMFCQLCGQPISGQGKSFQHPKWASDIRLLVCLDCYQNKPRCRVCDLPLAASSANGVCTTCNRHGRYCQACGQAIKNNYVTFEGVGSYCRECYHKRKPCDVCGAPLTEQQWKLSDGRISCFYCHTKAIYSPADASSLYEQMKEVIVGRLGLSLNVPTGLALVDRNQLAEVIRQQYERLPGDAHLNELDPHTTLGLYARRGIRRSIYVQSGLPIILFLQVAAHEYAHAWQGENCPILRDLLVHEGFAEWVAYKVLDYYGYSHNQERMIARQDIYGQGLRWALEIENKYGVEGLLQACRQMK